MTEENPPKLDFICNHVALGGGDLEKNALNGKVGAGDSDLMSRVFWGYSLLPALIMFCKLGSTRLLRS